MYFPEGQAEHPLLSSTYSPASQVVGVCLQNQSSVVVLVPDLSKSSPSSQVVVFGAQGQSFATVLSQVVQVVSMY